MSETRDELERVIGARRIGTIEVDGRNLPLALPGNEQEVVELLRLAREKSWRVLPVGAGTTLARGAPFERARFAIGTLALTGVVAYERGDGTITARAGTSMAALSAIARSGGNHLTPDVALAPRATLGGVLASAQSGIDRLRYGPIRNHVLGMRVVQADLTITKTGGRLVKNVTGFDLHRLYTGSRGSLCIIVEASLRLFPAPDLEIVSTASFFGRDHALGAAARVLACPAKPVCVIVENQSPAEEPWRVHVALSGRAEPVEWERDAVASILGRVVEVRGIEARTALSVLRDREAESSLRLACMPARLTSTLDALHAACTGHGLDPALAIQTGVATIDVTFRATDAGHPSIESIAAVAAHLREHGAEVEMRALPAQVRAHFHANLDADLAALALTKRLKHALDPACRFVGSGAPAQVVS